MTKPKYLIILFALFLFITACEIKAPKAPSWEVTWTLPLINEVYPVIDLANSDNIGIEEDAFMYFYDDGEIEGSEILSEDLKVSPNTTGSGSMALIPSFSGVMSLVDGDDDDTQISLGIVETGELVFDFTDVPSSISYINVFFHELYDSADNRVSLQIPRQSATFQYRYDMYEHTITDKNGPEAIVEEMNFDVTLFPGTAEGGFMRIYYNEAILFSYIEGLLHNFTFDVDDITNTIDVNYPTNIENAMKFNEPRMVFTVYSHIGFDTIFHATATSYNERSGLSETIFVSGFVNATTKGDSLSTTLVFDKMDEIDRLMNIAPDKVMIYDAYFEVLNFQDGRFGFANIGRAVSGGYITKIPFDFTFIADEAIRPTDLTEVEISEENRDEIRERARRAFINLTLRNFYSVGARVDMFLCSSENENLMFVPENVSTDTFSRLVFTENYMSKGSHLVGIEDTFYLEILQEDMGIFYKHEIIFVGMEITFDDGTTIIHPLEKLDVIGNIKVDIFVDF